MISVITLLLSFGLMFAEPAAMAWAYHWFVYPETHLALSYWAFFGLNFIMFLFVEYVPHSDLSVMLEMKDDSADARQMYALTRVSVKWLLFLVAWGVFFIVHLIIH